MKATTLSCSTMRLAMARAAAGSPPSSPKISLTGWPARPPRALTSALHALLAVMIGCTARPMTPLPVPMRAEQDRGLGGGGPGPRRARRRHRLRPGPTEAPGTEPPPAAHGRRRCRPGAGRSRRPLPWWTAGQTSPPGGVDRGAIGRCSSRRRPIARRRALRPPATAAGAPDSTVVPAAGRTAAGRRPAGPTTGTALRRWPTAAPGRPGSRTRRRGPPRRAPRRPRAPSPTCRSSAPPHRTE